ncbi:MATH-containing protein [Cryptosporidium canis]|uniref:MATH-containing protein n=1 Tax=Cryptosporidium canis TaxID=195482 RepID=A0A9D5HVM4_9CRYT|nr:MATH-containing protein [Cryptosporidium canis]
MDTPQSRSNNGDHSVGAKQQPPGHAPTAKRPPSIHLPMPFEFDSSDSSWTPSNPLDVFCLYSLKPDTDPTRRGRLKYAYMQPNDFLENHCYGNHKSNYVGYCDVAILLCVPPELKLQVPSGVAGSDHISKTSSSSGSTNSNDLDTDTGCLYTCPSHNVHSAICQSFRGISRTIPKIVSPLFKAKLADPLWSNIKFPMNDDSVAPLLIFKWFDQNTLDITLLSASICEARKSLRDCIVSWVFPRAKRLGLMPQSSSKETPNADDYTVLEECHVRVCQNVRRWTSSIKKINRNTGDVFIIQRKPNGPGSSQPLITECPFISPFISAALSSNSYSGIMEDFPPSLSRDDLLTIVTSMNTKRLHSFGIFNTPIKSVSGSNSPSAIELKKTGGADKSSANPASPTGGDSKMSFSPFFDSLKNGDEAADMLASQMEDLDINSCPSSSCRASMEDISAARSGIEQASDKSGSHLISGIPGCEVVPSDSKPTGSCLSSNSAQNDPASVSSGVAVVGSSSGAAKKKKKASKKLPGIPSLQKSSIVKALNAQRRLESQSTKQPENDMPDSPEDKERDTLQYTECQELDQAQSQGQPQIQSKSKSKNKSKNKNQDQGQDQGQSQRRSDPEEESTKSHVGGKETGPADQEESGQATDGRRSEGSPRPEEGVDLATNAEKSPTSVSLRPEKLRGVPEELYEAALGCLIGDSLSTSSLVSRLLDQVVQKFAEIYHRESSSGLGAFSEQSNRSEFLSWMDGLNELICNLSLIGGSKKIDQSLVQREIIQLLRRLVSNEPNSQQLSGAASENISNVLKSLEEEGLECSCSQIISNISTLDSKHVSVPNIIGSTINLGQGQVIDSMMGSISVLGSKKELKSVEYERRMYRILVPAQQRAAVVFTVLLTRSLSLLSPSLVVEMFLGLLPKMDYIKSNSLIKSSGYKSIKSFVLLAYFLYVFGVKDAIDSILSVQGVKGFENLLIRIASYTIGLRQYATSNFILENMEEICDPSPDWVSSLRITDRLAISEEILKKTLVVICDHFSAKSNPTFAQNKRTLDLIQSVEGIVKFSDIDDFAYEEAQLLEMRKVGKDVPQLLVQNSEICIIWKPPFWYCPGEERSDLKQNGDERQSRSGLGQASYNNGVLKGGTEKFAEILNSGRMEDISHFLRSRIGGIGQDHEEPLKLSLRLGVEIGGPVLVSKSQEVYDYYKGSQASDQIQCQYVFLCHGQIPNSSDRSVSLSNIVSVTSNRIFSKCLSSDGGDSIAKYTVCEHIKFKNYNKGSPSTFSLCTCISKPGNINKIRAYMHYIGHTIVGDSRYLGQRQLNLDRKYFPNIFFYCTHLEIPQREIETDETSPSMLNSEHVIVGKERIRVMAPIPKDILELLENDFEITERLDDMYYCPFYATDDSVELDNGTDTSPETGIKDKTEDNLGPDMEKAQDNMDDSGVTDTSHSEPCVAPNTLISSLPGLGLGLTPFLGMPNSQYAANMSYSQTDRGLDIRQSLGLSALSSSSGSGSASAPVMTSLQSKTNMGSFGIGRDFLSSALELKASLAGTTGTAGAGARHLASQSSTSGGETGGSLPIKTHPSLMSCLSELNSKSDGSGLGVGFGFGFGFGQGGGGGGGGGSSSFGSGVIGGAFRHQGVVSGVGQSPSASTSMGLGLGLQNLQGHGHGHGSGGGSYAGMTMSHGIGSVGGMTGAALGSRAVSGVRQKRQPQEQHGPGGKQGWGIHSILHSTRWAPSESTSGVFGGGLGLGSGSHEMSSTAHWGGGAGGSLRGVGSRGAGNTTGGLGGLSGVHLMSDLGIGSGGGSSLWGGQHVSHQQPSLSADPSSHSRHSSSSASSSLVGNPGLGLGLGLHGKYAHDGAGSSIFESFLHERQMDRLESRQSKKSSF